MTVLGALARPAIQNAIQATPWGDWGDGAGNTFAGANVTTQNALQLLTVYGCNRFIGDGISTLPVDAFRKVDNRGVEIKTPGIIEEPATDLDAISWSTQFLTSVVLGGDFFGFRVYRDTVLTQVIPLDPTKCEVFRRGGRKRFRVGGEEFSTFEILHVPGIMWPGAERGMSPVEAARQTIGQGMSAQEYAARFFDQDSTPGGVIEVPGELAPEQTRDMARRWAKKHSGKDKNGLPGVLQGGATWKQTSVTNEQAQFLETRKFTASEIAAQMFLIDPLEMGLPVEGSSLTYQNLEQRNARKVQVTFLPWIVRLEKALSSMLPRPQYVKLNVNGLLRGDTKTRLDGYAVGINNRFLTPNEARALEEMPPLEGGDDFPPLKTPGET